MSRNRKCVARFCGGPTQHRGVACEVHWGLLSLTAQQALDRWLDSRHPRGGSAATIPEALFAVSSAARGLVRAEWAALLRQDIEDGMYDDDPEVIAAMSA